LKAAKRDSEDFHNSQKRAEECGQPYSPVSDWIKQVDLVLEDESLQYGNMEEAANSTFSTHQPKQPPAKKTSCVVPKLILRRSKPSFQPLLSLVCVKMSSYPIYTLPALPTLPQRGISKPSGECWNHSQNTQKLEVKLT